jgi:hypothetical protein
MADLLSLCGGWRPVLAVIFFQSEWSHDLLCISPWWSWEGKVCC